jgi:hypothetical protein
MRNSTLLPVLIGAATKGALVCFLVFDDTGDLRDSSLERVSDNVNSIKNDAAESYVS